MPVKKAAGVILTVFSLISLFAVTALVFYLQSKSTYEHYEPWETESILSALDTNTSYDLLLMGSSHGRLLSRNRNHSVVEKKLQKNVATIAGGSSCVVPAEVFLDFFYSKKNSADTILYFIDPWCFYSDPYNNEYSFSHEPFDLGLLISMFKHQIDTEIMKDYITRTLRQGQTPYVDHAVQPKTEALEMIDEATIDKRLLDLYEGDIRRKARPDYLKTFSNIIRKAEAHQSKILFVIPATLYNDPHHTDLISLLEANRASYVDLSDVITDPKLYYDHDHLNRNGVEVYVNLLKNELNQFEASD